MSKYYAEYTTEKAPWCTFVWTEDGWSDSPSAIKVEFEDWSEGDLVARKNAPRDRRGYTLGTCKEIRTREEAEERIRLSQKMESPTERQLRELREIRKDIETGDYKWKLGRPSNED